MAITNTQLALYNTDGATLFKLAQTAVATAGLWDTANTFTTSTLSQAVELYAGRTYYVGLFVQAGTAGSFRGWAEDTNTPDPTNVMQIPMYTKGSETATAASYAVSALTATYSGIPWVALGA